MEDKGAQSTNPAGPTRPSNNNNNNNSSSGGGREDCWSEGATSALIDAWGDRYLQLSRGNLRQKDWKEVADAVNSRHDGAVKPPRTDVQCKNRVDTLKKKYKAEKAKPTPSKWPFFSRLHHLVGGTASASAAKKAVTAKAPALAVTKFTVKNLNSGFGRNSPSPVVAAMMEGGGYSGGGGGGGGTSTKRSRSRSRSSGSSGDEGQMGVGVGDGGEGFRELARAVVKFGKVYERIETAKQEQLMELERQRMEVIKDVEFQRTQMFMEAQIELEKLKRAAKYSSRPGKKL